VWRSIAVRLLNILVSALLIVLVAALFYKDYASVFRNNKELVKSLSPPTASSPSTRGMRTTRWTTCRW
jgi:glucan phosphoethanolaminetransferase (alkaline phosphatase superfamily)